MKKLTKNALSLFLLILVSPFNFVILILSNLTKEDVKQEHDIIQSQYFDPFGGRDTNVMVFTVSASTVTGFTDDGF